ncbi:hypothetical protein BU204_01895 [Actinophytocola xanthii]|uniref:NB-ARC domain-containing protein n=1 Tax=Actinophytocola xanthii TaxID=1912961 RepID=A0A1Q8CY77_9PSEU|nr:hypothetical protein BU204_01895 [Actinophytocola xanthii]
MHVSHAPLPVRAPVPRQLPPDVAGFTGRGTEMAALDALLAQDEPVRIGLIAGTAGVGKTALAVHWAHRICGEFPDGQLYVDLRGYSPDEPLSGQQALEQFLYGLGLPGQNIPTSVDAQTALYRSLLANRRLLVVLDNAYAVTQIRPLLPGSRTCLVLVTSRNGLSGLVSRDGAVRLRLGLLPNEDAMALLRHAVGAGRIDDEPTHAERLARLCAHLPLALRIAGERVADDEYSSLADVVGDLSSERERLDALGSEGSHDETTAVRSVFSWSYQALEADTARLFRHLGVHPGASFSIDAAAALLDRPPAEARMRLRQLADAHLVEPVARSRYAFHDLLKVYADERAEVDGRFDDGQAALRRLLLWYLHTADLADRALLPLHRRTALALPRPRHGVEEFADREHALAWCEGERSNLVAVVRRAAAIGEHAVAAHFPRALWSFFDLRKLWSEWILIYRIGLESARVSEDRDNEAWILSGLAVAHYDLEQFDRAIRLSTQSIVIRRVIGDRWGEAGTLSNLGLVYRRLGRYDIALNCLRRSLSIRRALGDRRGEAGSLSRLGATCRDLGRFEESLAHLAESLAIRREIGDQHGIGFALHSLGATYEQLGRLDEAVGCYRESLDARREIGDRLGQAANLFCLGKVLDRVHRRPESQRALEQALAIFAELESPQVAVVKDYLARRTGT